MEITEMQEKDENDPDYMPVCATCGNPMRLRPEKIGKDLVFWDIHCCGRVAMINNDELAERAIANLKKYWGDQIPAPRC